MRTPRRNDGIRIGWRFSAIAAVATFAGCSEELGPERMPTTSIRGTIKQSERPVGGGWIEFIPADGGVGNQRSAEIKADGSFESNRVPVGPVAIRLVDITIEPPFPIEPQKARWFFRGFPPPIRRTIPDHPSEMKIDLFDEFIAARVRDQALRNAASAPPANGSGAAK